jgi:hypothetical protein
MTVRSGFNSRISPEHRDYQRLRRGCPSLHDQTPAGARLGQQLRGRQPSKIATPLVHALRVVTTKRRQQSRPPILSTKWLAAARWASLLDKIAVGMQCVVRLIRATEEGPNVRSVFECRTGELIGSDLPVQWCNPSDEYSSGAPLQ